MIDHLRKTHPRVEASSCLKETLVELLPALWTQGRQSRLSRGVLSLFGAGSETCGMLF